MILMESHHFENSQMMLEVENIDAILLLMNLAYLHQEVQSMVEALVQLCLEKITQNTLMTQGSERTREGNHTNNLSGRSRDYRRDDEYSGYHKYMDGGKDYERSSLSGRESRSDTTDYSRREGKSDRSRGYWRNPDKSSRDTADELHRDRGRDNSVMERHKHKEKYNSSDGAASDKTVERDMHNRVRGGERDETREGRRSFREYKNDHTSSSGFKGEGKDLIKGKDNYGNRVKGSYEMDGQNAEAVEKRKHREGEYDRLKGRYDKEADEDSSIKKLKANLDSDTSFVKAREPVPKVASASDESLTSYSEAEFTDNLNAAKVAAMRAAEMVNKNLVGGGYMSTEQKKKLLWDPKRILPEKRCSLVTAGMYLCLVTEKDERNSTNSC